MSRFDRIRLRFFDEATDPIHITLAILALICLVLVAKILLDSRPI